MAANALSNGTIKVFLCGDVMTGRGIDQALPHPSDPRLYEHYVKDAREYLSLAERCNGPISTPLAPRYIWGEGLAELEQAAPDIRIINLETAVTAQDAPWPGKGINYRMHPKNIACLSAAQIDVCVLGNNHVMDWSYAGLSETIATLHAAGVHTVGAGEDIMQAREPAVFTLATGQRLLIFSYAMPSSGVPLSWAAEVQKAGVNLLPELGDVCLQQVIQDIETYRQASDRVILSIHWGGNWGYRIGTNERAFAQRLIDEANVDVVHGHSSHHPKAIEVYKDKLILYGCGDLINDYEGIGGQEHFRPDLALMYFAKISLDTGCLCQLLMSPMRLKNFQLHRATKTDTSWLQTMLSHHGRPFETRAETDKGGRLRLHW